MKFGGIIFFVVFFGVILSGCAGVTNKAAIDIRSYPPARVLIGGKEAGMTPYQNNQMKSGETEITLITEQFGSYTKKVKLRSNTTSILSWEFDGNGGGGYVITMEKTGDKSKAGLIVVADPDKSIVVVNGETKGYSPIRIDDIGEGEKEIRINFPGRKNVNLAMKSFREYQLIIEAKLGSEKEIEPIINPVPETITKHQIQKVKIKNTETGWLRVREVGSNGAVEVGKVKPNEVFELMEEVTDWYRIKEATISGWISAKYAEKILE